MPDPAPHPRPARPHRMVVGRRLRRDDGDLRPGGRARPPRGRLHRARGLQRLGARPGRRGRAPPEAGSRKDSAPPVTAAPPNRWAWSPGHLPGHRWPVRTPVTPTRERVPRHRRVLGRRSTAAGPRSPACGSSSGVELGEPNLFPAQVRRGCSRTVPSTAILGSMHCIEVEGELVDMSVPELLSPGAGGPPVPPLPDRHPGAGGEHRAVCHPDPPRLPEAVLAAFDREVRRARLRGGVPRGARRPGPERPDPGGQQQPGHGPAPGSLPRACCHCAGGARPAARRSASAATPTAPSTWRPDWPTRPRSPRRPASGPETTPSQLWGRA